jgi:hypothetical protein
MSQKRAARAKTAPLLFVILVALAVSRTQAGVRTVALSGQAAPGGGTFTSAFGGPVLNEAGLTAFFGTAGSQGVWSEGSGTLVDVARVGGQVPGIANATFVTLGPRLILNDRGHIAFPGFVSGPGIVNSGLSANARGVWRQIASGLVLSGREGDAISGDPNGHLNFSRFKGPALNNNDDVSFVATMLDFSGSGVGDIIVSRPATDNRIIAVSGTSTPGLDAPAVFDSFVFSSGSPALFNDNSQTAFLAQVGGGVPFTAGIWSGRANNLHLLAAVNIQPPGLPSGWRFFGFGDPSLNNAGHTVFHAISEFNNTASTRTGAIWSDRSGSLAIVAMTGNQAPGLDPSISLGNMRASTSSPSPVINHNNRIAYSAQLTGLVTTANDSAIFSDGFGVFAPVAREGDAVPRGGAAVFLDVSQVAPSINLNGQVAFSAQTSIGSGVFAQDLSGILRSIVLTGDSLEVVPGDFRTVSSVAFVSGAGNEDGRESAFSDQGQIAFRATFLDGSSGIFTSDIVAVPEPSTLILAIGFLASVTALGRRKKTPAIRA